MASFIYSVLSFLSTTQEPIFPHGQSSFNLYTALARSDRSLTIKDGGLGKIFAEHKQRTPNILKAFEFATSPSAYIKDITALQALALDFETSANKKTSQLKKSARCHALICQHLINTKNAKEIGIFNTSFEKLNAFYQSPKGLFSKNSEAAEIRSFLSIISQNKPKISQSGLAQTISSDTAGNRSLARQSKNNTATPSSSPRSSTRLLLQTVQAAAARPIESKSEQADSANIDPSKAVYGVDSNNSAAKEPLLVDTAAAPQSEMSITDISTLQSLTDGLRTPTDAEEKTSPTASVASTNMSVLQHMKAMNASHEEKAAPQRKTIYQRLDDRQRNVEGIADFSIRLNRKVQYLKDYILPELTHAELKEFCVYLDRVEKNEWGNTHFREEREAGWLSCIFTEVNSAAWQAEQREVQNKIIESSRKVGNISLKDHQEVYQLINKPAGITGTLYSFWSNETANARLYREAHNLDVNHVGELLPLRKKR